MHIDNFSNIDAQRQLIVETGRYNSTALKLDGILINISRVLNQKQQTIMKRNQAKVEKGYKQFLNFLSKQNSISVIRKIVTETLDQNLEKKILHLCQIIITKELKKMFGIISSNIEMSEPCSSVLKNQNDRQKKHNTSNSIKVSGKFYTQSLLAQVKEESHKETTKQQFRTSQACKNCGKGYQKSKMQKNMKSEVKNEFDKPPELRKIKSMTKIQANKISKACTNHKNEVTAHSHKQSNYQSSSKLVKSLSTREINKISKQKESNDNRDASEMAKMFSSIHLPKTPSHKLPQGQKIIEENDLEHLLYGIADDQQSQVIKQNYLRRPEVESISNRQIKNNMFSNFAPEKESKNQSQVPQKKIFEVCDHNSSYFSQFEQNQKTSSEHPDLNFNEDFKNVWENNMSVDLYEEKSKTNRQKKRIFLKMSEVFNCKSEEEKKSLKRFIEKNYEMEEQEMMKVYYKNDVGMGA